LSFPFSCSITFLFACKCATTINVCSIKSTPAGSLSPFDFSYPLSSSFRDITYFLSIVMLFLDTTSSRGVLKLSFLLRLFNSSLVWVLILKIYFFSRSRQILFRSLSISFISSGLSSLPNLWRKLCARI
jgi:hypothetical protein